MKKELKLEKLENEEMYVLVAPDGSPQTMTLAPDFAMCLGLGQLLASKGISEHPAKLFKEGFEILRVKVSIEQMGDAESAFQAAKKKLG